MLVPKNIKKRILDVAFTATKGHIGSALSVSDLIVSIFNFIIEENNYDQVRSSITLSKGHSALALYCCLHELNIISESELYSYEQNGSLFGTHPDPDMPWVNFIGGSLGQGISFATGLALADSIANIDRKHYIILSDSELNSGVVWEIATFAGTRHLNNIIVLLDSNKQQALDLTENILKYEDIATSFRVLGWSVSEVNGHDQVSLKSALRTKSNKPHLVIANTLFGAGISFMVGNIAWHYLPLTKELFEKASTEIEAMI
jgi:transketolase